MRRFSRLLLTVFLVAPACAAPAAAVRDRAPDPRLERVAWLPGDTRDLAYFRADQSPVLRTAKQIPLPIPKGSPSCFDKLVEQLESHYMVTAMAGGKAANLFYGRIDRVSAEACLGAMATVLGIPFGVRRDGAITEIQKESGSTFIGWSPDGWVVWHDDRARVERLLRREGGLLQQAGLALLIARTPPQATHWAISIADLSSLLLGVPSLGYLMSDPSMETAVVVFSNPAQAAQAVQAAEREIAAPRWSDGARQALRRLAPKAIGAEVHVSLAGMLAGASPEILAELTQAMKQYTDAMQAGQQPAPAP